MESLVDQHMSDLLHPQCEACWITAETTTVRYGTLEGTEIRRPPMVFGTGIERCCYCGKPTIVGIYRGSAEIPDPEHCLGHDVTP